MARTRKVIAVGVILLVVEFLVLPQVAGAHRALGVLAGANFGLVAAAVGIEVASLVAFAQLTRSTLPRQGRPSLATIVRIDLASFALGHIAPGGSAAGAALGYRLLSAEGVSAADAGFTLAAQGIGSAVVLNVLLWLSLVVAIPAGGFSPLYGTAAVLGLVLLGVVAVVILGLTRGEMRTAGWLRRLCARTRFVDATRVEAALHEVAARLHGFWSDPPMVARATGWATANWLLDAASLWILLLAFGHRLGPDALLVAYCLANVVAALPITPGGLGVTEAVLITLLVGFGTPREVAVLGALAYRLVNFWLPMPAGTVSYLSLRSASRRNGRPGAFAVAAVDERTPVRDLGN